MMLYMGKQSLQLQLFLKTGKRHHPEAQLPQSHTLKVTGKIFTDYSELI